MAWEKTLKKTSESRMKTTMALLYVNEAKEKLPVALIVSTCTDM